jgi:hypothetical protein
MKITNQQLSLLGGILLVLFIFLWNDYEQRQIDSNATTENEQVLERNRSIECGLLRKAKKWQEYVLKCI